MNPAQNKSPNSPENDLTQTLQRQADRFSASGGAGLDLEQVVSRAGEIRRGRRMRASMVMAAVVIAVAVPIGITAVGSDATKPRPPAPAASSKPDDSPIGLGDLKTGKAPRQGYAYEGTLHLGKDSVPLGNGGSARGLARIDGGFLVDRSSPNGDLVASFVADDGSGPSETWPTTGSFAVSPEGNVGAFVEPDGTVVAVQGGGSENFEVGKIPSGTGFDVAAVDGETCAGRSEEVGCTVYVQSSDGAPKVWAVSPNRDPEVAFPQFKKLAGIAADGTVAGMVSATDEGSCWEARDVEDVMLWDTCDHRFYSFSPGGKYLLGAASNGDGLGDTSLVVRDVRSGQVLIDLSTVPDATITDMTWDDDDHVLATVYYKDKTAVIRLEVNGSREYALDPVASTYDEPAPITIAH